ncbi:MAG TPA: DUF1360 domain-containing protein [Pseudonocardiaceae bacterium]
MTDQETPDGDGHGVVLAAFGGLVGVLAVVGRLTGSRLPERPSVGDTVLLSIATHKVSRLLTKGVVTGPLRAPFTTVEELTGEGEVNESPRGHHLRHTIGELLTCPFCLSVWVATVLTAGLLAAPRTTRLVATVLTTVTASDVLQLAYDAAKTAAEQAG